MPQKGDVKLDDLIVPIWLADLHGVIPKAQLRLRAPYPTLGEPAIALHPSEFKSDVTHDPTTVDRRRDEVSVVETAVATLRWEVHDHWRSAIFSEVVKDAAHPHSLRDIAPQHNGSGEHGDNRQADH